MPKEMWPENKQFIPLQQSVLVCICYSEDELQCRLVDEAPDLPSRKLPRSTWSCGAASCAASDQSTQGLDRASENLTYHVPDADVSVLQSQIL